MTFAGSLAISALYLAIGFIIGAAGAGEGRDIHPMVVALWPIALVFAIIVIFVDGIKELYRRMTGRKE